jgi:hypothetical protein
VSGTCLDPACLWLHRAQITQSAFSLKCVYMYAYIYLKKPVVIRFYQSATRRKYISQLTYFVLVAEW